MKIVLCMYSFLILLAFPTLATAQFMHYSDPMPDGLREAWTGFATALQTGDMPKVRSLSTSCVYCEACFFDEAYGDSSRREWLRRHPRKLMRITSKRYYSWREFEEEEIPGVFDANTLARLLDSNLIWFHNNAENSHLYAKPCIAGKRAQKIVVYEVLVTTIDRSGDREGLQKAFTFISTPEGFKFCGYSTIP